MSRKLSLQPHPDVYLIHRLLFRLLPVQILLAAVSQINGIISSLFASNYIGPQAMSAVGLYTPIGLLIGAVSVLFVSGSQIICGKFLGNNQVEQNSRLFSVSLLGTGIFALVTMLFLLAYTLPGFPGWGPGNPETRKLLNQYILGQIPGVLPLLWGQQLSAFLSMENRPWRSTMASLASVAVTIGMNYLLVVRYRLGTLGLAHASSTGLWVFLLVEAFHFLAGRSIFRFHMRFRDRGMLRELVRVSIPNSLTTVYAANVLNGLGCAAVIFLYSCCVRRKLPSNMEELMVIPDGFGAAEEDRLDLGVRGMEEVVQVSREVQQFCLRKGIDARRAAFAALAMEEMAGNIIEHGFPQDGRRHSVDLRIVYKNGDIMIRFKDDCKPFDPQERELMMTPEDPAKNIGLRIVFRTAKEHSYQNLLGLNVLTVKL